MKIIKATFVLLLVAGILYLLFTHRQFVRHPYICQDCTDELRVHFIHGSYPTDTCSDQRIRVGGRWGGHVEIEIDSIVYGFEYADRTDIHLFPRQRPDRHNSIFTRKQKTKWLEETARDKITTFRIPVTVAQKEAIRAQLSEHGQDSPYDYAFFGMRCTSSAYELLAAADIFPERSRLSYILQAFYPAQLRRKMLKWAERNEIPVVRQSGIPCRVWE